MPSSKRSSSRHSVRRTQLILVLILITLSALAGTARAWEWPKISNFQLPLVSDIRQSIKNTIFGPDVDSIKAAQGLKVGVPSAVHAGASVPTGNAESTNTRIDGAQVAEHDTSAPNVDSIKAGIDGVKDGVQDTVHDSSSVPSTAESITSQLDGAKEGSQSALAVYSTAHHLDTIKKKMNEARAALTDLAVRGAQHSKKIIMDGVVSIKALYDWVSNFRPYVPRSPGVSDVMRAALIAHGFEPQDFSFGLSTWWRGRDGAIAIVIGGVPSWEEVKLRAAADITSSSATASGDSGASDSASGSTSASDSVSASASDSANASATDTSPNAYPLSELTLVMRVVARYGEGFGLSAERLNANASMTSLGVWNKTSMGIMGLSLGPVLKLGLSATASVTPEQASAANADREGYRVKMAFTLRANAKLLSDAVKRGLKLIGHGLDRLEDLTKFSAKLYELELFFPARLCLALRCQRPRWRPSLWSEYRRRHR
jgi:hypothetical protein